LVFIFANNLTTRWDFVPSTAESLILKVVRYNNPNKVWVISDSLRESTIKLCLGTQRDFVPPSWRPKMSEAHSRLAPLTLRVFNNFISDSLPKGRESTINTSKLVFIFVNNLKVVRYNNPNKVWVISVMFDQRSNITTIKLCLGTQRDFVPPSWRPKMSEAHSRLAPLTLRVFNNFISDSLPKGRESTINTSKLVFIFVNNIRLI